MFLHHLNPYVMAHGKFKKCIFNEIHEYLVIDEIHINCNHRLIVQFFAQYCWRAQTFFIGYAGIFKYN